LGYAGSFAIIEKFFRAEKLVKAVVREVRAAKSTHPPIKGVRQKLIMASVSGGWRFNP
jgi:hypothetical protein